MMKKNNSNLFLVLLLTIVSIVMYVIQLVLFNSPRDTEFYFLQDMAFLPLQVAIVTLFLNSFIDSREKRERLKKMNMAINAFFGEAGIDFLLVIKQFARSDAKTNDGFLVNSQWLHRDFQKAISDVGIVDFGTNARKGDLENMKSVLIHHRPFLMSMLENANLLEHDHFTDMLWAVFHIMDELVARETFLYLPETDLDHLSLDINRAYHSLLIEWLRYMEHLKVDYPYLFSMAVRKNPFDEHRNVVFD